MGSQMPDNPSAQSLIEDIKRLEEFIRYYTKREPDDIIVVKVKAKLEEDKGNKYE